MLNEKQCEELEKDNKKHPVTNKRIYKPTYEKLRKECENIHSKKVLKPSSPKKGSKIPASTNNSLSKKQCVELENDKKTHPLTKKRIYTTTYQKLHKE